MKLSLFILIISISTKLSAQITSAAINYQEGCRRGIIKRATPRDFNKLFSPIRENDRAEDLIDGPAKMVKSISEMDRLKLHNAKIKQLPWSDSYWPIYKGGISQRYQDPEISNLDWKGARDYVTQNTVDSMLASGRWNELSPAEKYDSLLELKSFPITESSWSEGHDYFAQYGDVESWMGYCHGWAAASIMTPEPKKIVNVEMSSGKVTLYPSDIKALNTFLWAKGDFPTKYIGGRCNDKDPAERENDCMDNNPGTWHLAVVNQIGISRRSFIMDANFDYEVWNHPVFAYDYTYVNPKTGKHTSNLNEALMKRGSFHDKKEKFRARETAYIVGIEMMVDYAVENSPSTDEDQRLMTAQVQYAYDLELDANGNIIGGEWKSDSHPDFLWVPVRNSYPKSYGDTGNIEINFSKIPDTVKKFAQTNAKQGLPWGPIVRHLVQKSAR